VVIPLTGKSHIHLFSRNKYTSINFLTHEDIKLIEYGPRTNISFNNFKVLNPPGLGFAPQKPSMAKSETINVIIILCQYSTLIINKFLRNIINNPKTQILIKKNTNPKLYEKNLTKFETETLI